MKKGLIIVNAYCEMGTNLNQSIRLKEELELLGVKIDILKNDKFLAKIDNGETVTNLNCYDFCIYLDKDKYISKMLENRHIRLFNCHNALQFCDDKMLTHIELADNLIPMPKTISGLLCYTPNSRVKEESLDILEKELGFPLVVKNSYGSLGEQVYLATDKNSLREICQKNLYKPHLFQEYIKESCGMDIRVIVIGNKPIVAMKRVSSTDFRSNVELGGVGQKYDLDEGLIGLCSKVSKILNLDYCGIDILISKNGYMVCEVNSNAFFGGIEKVTGINVAKAYAEYIVKQIYGDKK